MFFITIHDINNWDDIYKNIRHNYNSTALKDFIILKGTENNYSLLSESNIPDNEDFECFLLPYHYQTALSKKIFHNQSRNFHNDPTYHIVYKLYEYRDNIDTYMLLWFNAATKQMVHNCEFDYLNRKIVIHIYEITSAELENRNLFYLYGMNRKNFCPIERIDYYYKNICNSLDTNDVAVVIEYIHLLINLIKSEYRMYIIYDE